MKRASGIKTPYSANNTGAVFEWRTCCEFNLTKCGCVSTWKRSSNTRPPLRRAMCFVKWHVEDVCELPFLSEPAVHLRLKYQHAFHSTTQNNPSRLVQHPPHSDQARSCHSQAGIQDNRSRNSVKDTQRLVCLISSYSFYYKTFTKLCFSFFTCLKVMDVYYSKGAVEKWLTGGWQCF